MARTYRKHPERVCPRGRKRCGVCAGMDRIGRNIRKNMRDGVYVSPLELAEARAEYERGETLTTEELLMELDEDTARHLYRCGFLDLHELPETTD